MAHPRPFRVYARKAPEGTRVALDLRDPQLLDVAWTRVALEDASAEGVTLVPPLTGWYRLRIIAPTGGIAEVCEHQD